MTNSLLLVLYFAIPVMIYAAPQLNTGNVVGGLTIGGLGGGSNGVLGSVSNTISGGGNGGLGGTTGTVTNGITRGGLLGRSQNAAEKLEGLGGSDCT
ncbi:hypothetical protein Agabi119p4_1334 [Agaricus bisporus var. burnettii]|uniref:Uncharacterized protein n=1 Tax=Agaricus bisporus var. burnettii TaxID=192524 RepID=A0A8H7KMP6_AGABI|nr:hypothetical protein Agabi119p4_1334 [Agaricus bisporus var. burnettii]